MPTTYTRSIGTTSRDYSTFALAAADVASFAGGSDLVSNDANVVFEVYNDSVFTGAMLLNSLTTDATRNVRFTVPAAERHDGTPGTGARWEPTGGEGFSFNVNHTVVEYMEFRPTATGGFSTSISSYASTVGCEWRDCIIQDNGGTNTFVHGLSPGPGSSSFPSRVTNCVFLDWDTTGSYGLHANLYNGSNPLWLQLVNCTFSNCTNSVTVSVDSGVTATVEFVNLLSLNLAGGSDWTAPTGTLVSTGSANNFGESSGGSAFPGTGSPNPITGTTTRVPGAGDWAIYPSATNVQPVQNASNDIIDAGVGPDSNSLVPTTDIAGNARSGSTTEPGAFVAGVVALLRTVGATGRDYASFTLAEADINTLNGSSEDLVAQGNQITFEAYNDAVFSENITIDGNGFRVMDATRNVIFRAATGEQHTGTPTTGVRVQQAMQAMLVSRDSDFVVFDGIVFESTAATSFGSTVIASSINSTFEGATFRNCIFYMSGGSGTNVSGLSTGAQSNALGSASNPITVENCAFIGYSTSNSCGMLLGSPSADLWTNVVSCTMSDCHTSVLYEVNSTYTLTTQIVNCLSLNTGANGDFDWIYGNAGTLVTTGSANNFGEDGTNSFPGTGSPYPITGTTSTSPGAGDWAIYTSATDLALVDDPDNDVLAGGVGPASNSLVPTTDILGASRSGTTADPGAWQVSTAGGGPTTGTGSLTLGSVSLSGSGTVTTPPATITGTGSLTLGSVSLAGTGTAFTVLTGTGSLTLGSVSLSGTGSVSTGISGTGSLTLGSVSLAGTGTVYSTVTGTGSLTLGSVSLSGTGTVSGNNTGTGSLTLGSVSLSGSGVAYSTPTGTGSLTLGSVSLSGSGTVIGGTSGTGSLTLDSVSLSGAGTVYSTITGTGSLTLGSVSLSGTSTALEIIQAAHAYLVASWVVHVSKQDQSQQSPF